MDDRFERVHIGRRRVNGGFAAVGMGLLAASLALDLVYLVSGGSGWYDASWFTLLAGAVALVASIAPGIMAWLDEGRRSEAYMARDDDGRVVVIATAFMVTLANLVLRYDHGAVVGPELGTACALTVLSLGLMGFAGPIGDYLADRFPAGRRGMRVESIRERELERERETTRF